MTFRHLVTWIYFLCVTDSSSDAGSKEKGSGHTRKYSEGLKHRLIMPYVDFYIHKCEDEGLNMQEILVSRQLELNAETLNSNEQ